MNEIINESAATALRAGAARRNGSIRSANGRVAPRTPGITGPHPLERAVRGQALHRALLTVDIAGFASRDFETQAYVRDTMYRILRQAFDDSTIPWDDCYHEDRGDGVLIVVSPDISTAALIDPLIGRLSEGLRFHNRMSSDIARIELRVALHAGHIRPDAHGVVGPAVIHAFRLLDAQSFKDILRKHSAILGFIVSGYVYEEVIRDGIWYLDPLAYLPLDVEVKETITHAWIHLAPDVTRRVRGVAG